MSRPSISIGMPVRNSQPRLSEGTLALLLQPRLARGGEELYRKHLSWERIADEPLATLASADG